MMLAFVDVLVFVACVIFVASKLHAIADWIVERML